MNATWTTTETGQTYHSFKADGVAICRSNIKADQYRGTRTETQVDEALAQAWGISTQGYRKCGTCAKKEAAHRDRVAASLAPSTGEGDHLPPAAPVAEVAVITPSVTVKVTPEVIEALTVIRGVWHDDATQRALDVLDNAGIFAAIDEANGYDVAFTPEPVRVSRCTCPDGLWDGEEHLRGCLGDPAEWGDMAYSRI